jgi:chemotaxis protein methyltransferase CheR
MSGGNTWPVMSQDNFRQLSEYIQLHYGIKIPPVKKTMLEGRLRKRLRILGIDTFDAYCRYLFSRKGINSEFIQMIDVVTTNKTDFFRECGHFDYLVGKALPELSRTGRKIEVWSAGCSTGEEPYTLAMVLTEFAETCKIDFSIVATDISTRVLKQAKSAVYTHDRVEPVPMPLRKKYLLRGKDRRKGLVRIMPQLRAKVQFRRLNLMDRRFSLSEQMAVIFCRNVMIYFDRATQEELLNRFCDHLIPGGYIFTGHSETLHGMELPLVSVAPTIYKKI